MLLFTASHHTSSGLRALQEKIATGDEDAFAKLFGLFSKKLEAFSFSLVHSREIAEEVVEDVFINIWIRRATIANIGSLSVYLYVAVKNRSLSRLSEKAHKLMREPFSQIDPQVQTLQYDPHAMLVTSEMLGKLNDAIENLPPRCKMIFKLVREDGLRYKEVAEILNISVNTIDAQMAIAIKRLCEAFGLPGKRPQSISKITSTR